METGKAFVETGEAASLSTLTPIMQILLPLSLLTKLRLPKCIVQFCNTAFLHANPYYDDDDDDDDDCQLLLLILLLHA